MLNRVTTALSKTAKLVVFVVSSAEAFIASHYSGDRWEPYAVGALSAFLIWFVPNYTPPAQMLGSLMQGLGIRRVQGPAPVEEAPTAPVPHEVTAPQPTTQFPAA